MTDMDAGRHAILAHNRTTRNIRMTDTLDDRAHPQLCLNVDARGNLIWSHCDWTNDLVTTHYEPRM